MAIHPYLKAKKMDSIFKDNPGLDVAYKTADGKYFYTENGAQNHALTLKNQEVKKVVRTEEATEKEEVKNEVVIETEEPKRAVTAEPSEPSKIPEPSENSDNSENSDSSESSENLDPLKSKTNHVLNSNLKTLTNAKQ
jgi:hypothetical protein